MALTEVTGGTEELHGFLCAPCDLCESSPMGQASPWRGVQGQQVGLVASSVLSQTATSVRCHSRACTVPAPSAVSRVVGNDSTVSASHSSFSFFIAILRVLGSKGCFVVARGPTRRTPQEVCRKG